jgi:hypothetical protein
MEGWVNNSNWNLRFPRDSRSVYGSWASFEPDHHWAEPYLWVGAVFGFGMLFGAWLF